MIEFKPLTTEHIPLLIEYLREYPRENCDYSICNLMTWGRIYTDMYTIWKDRLVIINPKYQYVCYPVGPELRPVELRELISDFQIQYPEAQLILIPELYYHNHPELNEYFDLAEQDGWADYVYSAERMVNLSGKKLAKKKNLISQFNRAYPDHKVLEMNAGHCAEVISFAAKWKRERALEGIYLNTEMKALQYSMEMWDDIPSQGIIICHQHTISAFSIFSPQTADMATVHFEKYDPDMKGSAQYINYETSRFLMNDYKWINRESDMDLDGLRQAKRSYLPDYMAKFIAGIPK